MAKSYPRKRVRIRLDVTSDGNAPDLITNTVARVWRGTDVQFDLGIFYKAATADDTDVIDLSNVATLGVEAKVQSDLTGASVFQKIINAVDLNTGMTKEEWDAGTDEHCSVALTKEEMLLDLGGDASKTFRVFVYVTTTDDPDRKIVYGSFLLKVDETGIFGNEIAPLVGGNIVPSEQAYDGSGEYELSVTEGKVYEWTKGANDLTLVNGNETLSATDRFTAQGSTVTMTGTPSAVITATVRGPSYFTAAEADARFRWENVIDVRRYGATDLTGNSDVTTAIEDAITAAAALTDGALNDPKPTVYVPHGVGLRISSPLVLPIGVQLCMDAPFIVDASMGDAVALTIGEAGPGKDNHLLHHKLQVVRESTGDWSDEAQIGIKILNAVTNKIDLVRVEGFTIGMQMKGEGSDGFSYNHVWLGRLANNKIGLDLTSSDSGWCTENQFYGGRWFYSSSAGTGLSRIGIRIGSATGLVATNNRFYSPSFELNATVASPSEALPVLIVNGTDTLIHHPRHEGNSTYIMRCENDSARNLVVGGYTTSTAELLVSNDDRMLGGMVLGGRANWPNIIPMRTVFNSGPLWKKACYYNGTTSTHLPGISIQTSNTTPEIFPSRSSVSIQSSYVELTTNIALQVFMDTRHNKRFAIWREGDNNQLGRVGVRCYDSSDAVLTSAGGNHPYAKANHLIQYVTSYGGAYLTQDDAVTGPVIFEVGADVAYVAILIAQGSSNARIRSFQIAVPDGNSASVWSGYEDIVPGANLGTAAPTQGTWVEGRRIYNAARETGVDYWDCVEGGSPGTWVAIGRNIPVTLTDAATIATNAALGNLFRVTLGGNRTLGNPTNSVQDGQRVTWELIQDATGSRTLTLDTKFALGSDIASVTLTTTASKRDFLTAVYNLAADKWFVVDFKKGY